MWTQMGKLLPQTGSTQSLKGETLTWILSLRLACANVKDPQTALESLRGGAGGSRPESLLFRARPITNDVPPVPRPVGGRTQSTSRVYLGLCCGRRATGATGPPRSGCEGICRAGGRVPPWLPGMSVAFVPDWLRGKAEVNQETIQRVSAKTGREILVEILNGCGCWKLPGGSS